MTSSTHLIVLWLFFLFFYNNCIGEDVRVLKDVRVFNLDGSYYYNVILSNGQEIYEMGYLKRDETTGEEFLVKEGYSTYIGPDGKNYTVKYLADENGYVGEGDHIYKVPTSPKELTTQRPTQQPPPSPPPTFTTRPRPPSPPPTFTTRPPPKYTTERSYGLTQLPVYPKTITNADLSNLGCGNCDIAGEEVEPTRRRRKIQLLMEVLKKLPYFIKTYQ